MGLEHIVDRGLGDLADQHLVLARLFYLQLNEPGLGREGHRVDGRAGAFGEVLDRGDDHSVVNVGG